MSCLWILTYLRAPCASEFGTAAECDNSGCRRHAAAAVRIQSRQAVGGIRAVLPVSATVQSQWKRTVGPVRPNSSAAASAGLPTSALASLWWRLSMGPEGGTPTCHSLTRPGQSWTDVCRPAGGNSRQVQLDEGQAVCFWAPHQCIIPTSPLKPMLRQ
jgi:hypothetical protein